MIQQLASYNFRSPLDALASLRQNQALVSDEVVLDGRLALFHNRQRWLAVADLHFGYEISQRAAGRLMPLWGMRSVEDRLTDLLADYRPERLVILGDLVHDRSATAEVLPFLERLRSRCEVILLAGNHDRHVTGAIQMLPQWQCDGFHFHHGHCEAESAGRIQIIGHHHPAGTIRDGAGLRLKLPAFVQQDDCWIMPAFSPWAAGAPWQPGAQSRMWLCTPARILRLPDPAAVG